MSLRRGFSFLEVIIVVGILAVLAGIIYGATGGVREKARETVCATNLSQIYDAMSLYDADNQNPPIVEGLGDIINVPNGGVLLIEPYLRSSDVLNCPNATPAMRTSIGSTYMWGFYEYPSGPNAGSEHNYDVQLENKLVQQGEATPIVTCQIHYLTYYENSIDEDPSLSGVFENRLLLNGSVVHGWFPDQVFNVY